MVGRSVAKPSVMPAPEIYQTYGHNKAARESRCKWLAFGMCCGVGLLRRCCRVRVRSRDESPTWGGWPGELVNVAVLLVRVAVARFDALADVTAGDWRSGVARLGEPNRRAK
jgi:hypothetical protein